jgi:polar amino acid transport system permease protein
MNYTWNWDVIWRARWDFAGALGLGLGMAVVALAVGSVLGLVIAYGRISPRKWLSVPAYVYVEFFRNAPLLLLVFFVYFGLPELGIYFIEAIESFTLTLALYAAGYMSEVFRTGLASMPKQYVEAAKAIGMRPWQRQRYVVLPLMFRITLPAISNNLISLFKDTSVATAIAVPELTFMARQVNANSFRVMEAWLTATLLYLLTAYAIALILRAVERRMAMVR